MPRHRRQHVPGGLYHAVLRGNHRQAIFGSDDDHRQFEWFVAGAVQRYGASVHAYCWMTNHVHLAIRVAEAPLGAIMGIVASRYARAAQRAIPTTGHLFERRYHARLVDADRYLLALVRYIHLNPVRAGLVPDAREYPWSSHLAYLDGTGPGWLELGTVTGLLGTTEATSRAAYIKLMGETPAATETEEITVRTSRLGRSRVVEPRAAKEFPSAGRRPRSLEEIVVEVAGEFAVAPDLLGTMRREARLVAARREIARRALLEGAANLSQVARRLNRTPSTYSEALNERPRARRRPQPARGERYSMLP